MLIRYVDEATGLKTFYERRLQSLPMPPLPKIGEHVALPRKAEDIPTPAPGIAVATHDFYSVVGVNHYVAEDRVEVFLRGPV